MAHAAPLAAPVVAVDRRERFYFRMAGACLAVAILGFAPTYWVPLLRGTLHVSPLTHVHAALFYGWLLLFVKQTSLVASGRVGRHRDLGLLGIAIATSMFFVGMGLAVNGVRQADAAGLGVMGRSFFIVPSTGITLFIALFAVAIANVKNPETHKRVLLVATASLLQAAIGRWFALVLAPPVPPGFTGTVVPPPLLATIVPGVLGDLLFVAGMIHDRRTRGRVHRAYWWAGAAVLAVQVLRAPIAGTVWWARVTDGILAVVP